MKRTHITFILDRTGSMQDIKEQTIEGFNTFLKDQQKQAGMASMLLVQFDSEDPFEILADFSNINDVSALNSGTYVPRSTTPLFDAIARGVTHTEEELAKLPHYKEPELVIVAILTDGYENASKEYTDKAAVAMMSGTLDHITV